MDELGTQINTYKYLSLTSSGSSGNCETRQESLSWSPDGLLLHESAGDDPIWPPMVGLVSSKKSSKLFQNNFHFLNKEDFCIICKSKYFTINKYCIIN